MDAGVRWTGIGGSRYRRVRKLRNILKPPPVESLPFAAFFQFPLKALLETGTLASTLCSFILVFFHVHVHLKHAHREYGLKAGATVEYKIEAWSLFGRSEAAVFSGRTPLYDPSSTISTGNGASGGVSCEASSSDLLTSSLLHQGWLGTLIGGIWQVMIILTRLFVCCHLIVSSYAYLSLQI